MINVNVLKNTIITLVFLNVFLVSNAQEEPQCGTVVSPETQAYFEQLLPQIQQFEDEFSELTLQRSSSAINSVPIKAHIIRSDAGLGGLSESDLNDALSIMNSFYANAFLEFFLCEGINYIDDSSLYDFETDDQEAMTTANNVGKVINIYFCKYSNKLFIWKWLMWLCIFPWWPRSNRNE